MGTLVVVIILFLVVCFMGEYFLGLIIPLFLVGMFSLLVYSCAKDDNTNVNLYEEAYEDGPDERQRQKIEEVVVEVEESPNDYEDGVVVVEKSPNDYEDEVVEKSPNDYEDEVVVVEKSPNDYEDEVVEVEVEKSLNDSEDEYDEYDE